MCAQLKMNEFMGGIMQPGQSHLACALLLDVSGSMYGPKIKSLNRGIRLFKEKVAADPVARERVDVVLVTFGSTVEVQSDFASVTAMPTPELEAGGCTEMAAGIHTAIELVKERSRMYSNMGTPCHKPWIFMITDGAATSSDQEMQEVARRVREEESKGSHGHLTFWALGVDDYDSRQLFMMTDHVMELKDQDFTNIFDWFSESMAFISRSRVGEDIELSPLPDNVVYKDRM